MPAPEPPESSSPSAARSVPPAHDRVGIVLVSHSPAVAEAVAELAVSLVGTGDPAPVLPAGGTEDGGLGTSSQLILAAARRADQGQGVVFLSDIGSAVLTVKSLLADADRNGMPFPARLVNAPFVEGAVAATVTASAGGDLAAVVEAAEDALTYRK